MLRHLRLARARGSLTAPNSRVQDRALDYLNMLDEARRQDDRMDMVKGLLATGRTEEVVHQFPEYFEAEGDISGAYDEAGEFDIDRVDDSKVKWAAPASREEDDEISAWIAQHENTYVTAADDGWV